jgi:hypothetical protein
MTSNQYRVYYKGLRKRPTYEGLINYLANEQEMIQYPNRMATQMRNHPYLTQLDGDDYDHMTEQQLNILRAKMSEDKIKEQAAKPGGPGTAALRAAASGASSSSSSVMSGGGGSASSGGYESIAGSSQASRTGRPFFLPRSGSDASGSRQRGTAVARPSVHDMASPRSSRSSAASSPHLQDNDALIRAQMAEQERLNRQYEDEEEAKKTKIKQMAQAAITNMYGTAVDKVMKMQQEKEADRQKQQLRAVSAERSLERQSGATAARNRGESPFSAKPRSVGTEGRIGSQVRTLADLPKLDTQPETKDVVIYDATKKVYDNKGKEKVTIEDKVKYYSNLMRNRTTAEQNLIKIGVPESEFRLLSLKDMVRLWLERYKVPEIQKHKEKVGQLAKTGASSSTGR